MKLIPLSHSRKNTKKHFVKVDDEDYDWLMQWKWQIQKNTNTLYGARRDFSNNKRLLFIHRVIMKTPKRLLVDHIDHDGLNCQKSNMRNCTYLQNARNRSSRKNSTSKYIGVSLFTKKNKYRKDYTSWQANIKPNVGTPAICLGRFKDEKVAARCYNRAAKKYFSKFANLNKL